MITLPIHRCEQCQKAVTCTIFFTIVAAFAFFGFLGEIESRGKDDRILTINEIVSTSSLSNQSHQSEDCNITLDPSSSPVSSACIDQEGWTTFDPSNTYSNITCDQIAELPSVWCVYFALYPNEGIGTYDACCACQDGEGENHVSYPPSEAPSDFPSAAPSHCIDDPTFIWDEDIGLGCSYMSPSFCELFSGFWYEGKNTYSACCICGGSANAPSVVPSASPNNATTSILVAGNYHACALLKNYQTDETPEGVKNTLLCWGSNSYSRLGLGYTSLKEPKPLQVDLGQNRYAVQISIGYAHSCAITSNDELVCWGWNAYGQLGDGEKNQNGSLINVRTPKIIDLGSNHTVKKVALGWYHSCALTMEDILLCWGRNDFGQPGDGTLTNNPLPRIASIGSAEYAMDIVAGMSYTCVLTNLNNVLCWGRYSTGYVGNGSSQYSSISTLDHIVLKAPHFMMHSLFHFL